MAINHVLMDHLEDGGRRRAEDLPGTAALFHEFARAGLDTDKLSPQAQLKCARVALREEVDRGYLARDDVADVYAQIHDAAIEADDAA